MAQGAVQSCQRLLQIAEILLRQRLEIMAQLDFKCRCGCAIALPPRSREPQQVRPAIFGIGGPFNQACLLQSIEQAAHISLGHQQSIGQFLLMLSWLVCQMGKYVKLGRGQVEFSQQLAVPLLQPLVNPGQVKPG